MTSSACTFVNKRMYLYTCMHAHTHTHTYTHSATHNTHTYVLCVCVWTYIVICSLLHLLVATYFCMCIGNFLNVSKENKRPYNYK